MATTIKFGSTTYQLTDSDVLWAGRMAYCEGGDARDPAAVLWTMTQRFALLYPRFTSFEALIKNYSQCINPRWRRGGEFCGSGGRYADQENRCGERVLDKRDRYASMSWDELPAAIRYTTSLWAKGMLPNPVPRAVDFADPNVTAGFVARTEGAEYVARYGNHFVSVPASQRWPSNYVTMGRSFVWDAIRWGATGLAAAGLGWWLWKRFV